MNYSTCSCACAQNRGHNKPVALQRLPIPPLSGNSAKRITFTSTKPVGTKLASIDGYYIGTLYRGEYGNNHARQAFCDVAFPRTTYDNSGKNTTGIMLSFETFDNEKQAIDFLTSLVLAQEVA